MCPYDASKRNYFEGHTEEAEGTFGISLFYPAKNNDNKQNSLEILLCFEEKD